VNRERRQLIEARRPHYAGLISDGLATLFEERRATCPSCNAEDLRELLRTPDRFQGKPGRFELDECPECGLVFQNPRLSPKGLEYYYGDFYEGLGGALAEVYYGVGEGEKVRQAKRVEGLIRAHRWLDVGGGNGSFCRVAAVAWPEVRFELLDGSALGKDAVTNGWVADFHQEPLVDVAPRLEGRFDVVTMHHYLEHTAMPEAEIAAARRVLAPGGVLVIEVPDPECRFGRLLRSYWWPWLQPQHLFLFPASTMATLIERHGFEVVRVERAGAHTAIDFLSSLLLVAARILPAEVLPWNAKSGRWREVVRGLMLAVGAPLFLLAHVADRAWAPIARRGRQLTNVYAIVARRTESVAGGVESPS
jgi:2-polyprenyl-3-methyl-5-hydroxy-6-metoxy-1,4-benzoquinol methylase